MTTRNYADYDHEVDSLQHGRDLLDFADAYVTSHTHFKASDFINDACARLGFCDAWIALNVLDRLQSAGRVTCLSPAHTWGQHRQYEVQP